MALPKYFDNLKLAISAITGQARIVKFKKPDDKMSDVYKDIPDEEFKNVMLNYFGMYKPGNVTVSITNDLAFLFGGKMRNKQEMLDFLNSLVAVVEKLDETELDKSVQPENIQTKEQEDV